MSCFVWTMKLLTILLLVTVESVYVHCQADGNRVDMLIEPGTVVYNDFVGLLPDAIFPGPSFDYADGDAIPLHLCYRYGDPDVGVGLNFKRANMGYNLSAQIDPPELFFNINVDRARSAVLVTEDGFSVSVNGNNYFYTNKINNTANNVVAYRPKTEFSIGKMETNFFVGSVVVINGTAPQNGTFRIQLVPMTTLDMTRTELYIVLGIHVDLDSSNQITFVDNAGSFQISNAGPFSPGENFEVMITVANTAVFGIFINGELFFHHPIRVPFARGNMVALTTNVPVVNDFRIDSSTSNLRAISYLCYLVAVSTFLLFMY